MPISHVKTARAMRAADIGRYPATAEAMLGRVPGAVAAALTGAQLGALLDTIWYACQEAKGIAAREAIAEGAVWDERAHRMREIA